MPRNRLCLVSPLVAATFLLSVGCGGYTSEYVPPADGRPRLLWEDNRVVPAIANAVPAACNADVDSLAGGSSSVRVHGRVAGGGGGGTYYVPTRTVVVVHAHGHGVAPLPRPFIPLPGAGLGKIGGGGGGGGGDLGKAAIVVAVLAIAVLPFIALGLATGRPEDEEKVADAIDRVNAHTDLARTEGSPCDELIVAGQVSQ